MGKRVLAHPSLGVRARHALTLKLDHPSGAGQSFFGAAATVTGPLGLGGAEVATEFGLGYSGRASGILNSIGTGLYARVNLPTYYALYDGKNMGSLSGLSGRQLDYALVHQEQSYVQGQLNGLSASDRSMVIGQSNSILAFSPNSVIQRAIGSLGHPFNFGNQGDREAIGKALTDAQRRIDGCPTGTRVC